MIHPRWRHTQTAMRMAGTALAAALATGCGGDAMDDANSALADPGATCDALPVGAAEGDECVGEWSCSTGAVDGCAGAVGTFTCAGGVLGETRGECAPDADGDDAGAMDAGTDGDADVGVDPGDSDLEIDAGPETDADAMPDAADADITESDAGIDDGGITPQSGTRLVLTGYAAGALFSAQGVFDSERGESCGWMATSPVDATNEVLHCVPQGFGELRYADAACTIEAVRIRASVATCGGGPTTGDVVRAYAGASCGANPLVIRTLGAAISAETAYRRDASDGSCVAEPMRADALFGADPAQLDQLVAGRHEARPSGEPGLDIELTIGEDGSRFFSGLRWSDGEACVPQQVVGLPETSHPCVPTGALLASDNTFADAACSEPVFTGLVDPSCEVERTWDWGTTAENPDGCYLTSSLVHLGAPVSDAWVGPADVCTPHTGLPDTWRSYTGAEEVPLDSIPSVTTARIGDGRLQLVVAATRDGDTIHSETDWWDTETGVTCRPRQYGDGVVRCIPDDASYDDGLFSDSACTVPAYAPFVGGCNPAADARRVRLEQSFVEASCAYVVSAVYALVPHDGPVYRNEDTCVEVTLDPGRAAFVDGELYTAADFAAFDVVP